MGKKHLQGSLGANSLELLAPVTSSGLLSSGKSLKGVSLHRSTNGSHGGEDRELSASSSSGGSAGNDGRHF